MKYKSLWIKLKEKLVYWNEHSHPRFKHMQEKPTIPIIRVIDTMEEMENGKKNENKIY